MIVCGDCGGEVRSRLVHYRRDDGGFDRVEHWQCVEEIRQLKLTRTGNPTHRVRVSVGSTDRSPLP
jgi:hypothetical protein